MSALSLIQPGCSGDASTSQQPTNSNIYIYHHVKVIYIEVRPTRNGLAN